MIVNAIAYRSKAISDDADLTEMVDGRNYVVLQCFDETGFQPVRKVFLPNECHHLYVLAKHTVAFCLIDIDEMEDPVYVGKAYVQGYSDLVTADEEPISALDLIALEMHGDTSYIGGVISAVAASRGISAKKVTPKDYSQMNNLICDTIKPFRVTCTLPIKELT